MRLIARNIKPSAFFFDSFVNNALSGWTVSHMRWKQDTLTVDLCNGGTGRLLQLRNALQHHRFTAFAEIYLILYLTSSVLDAPFALVASQSVLLPLSEDEIQYLRILEALRAEEDWRYRQSVSPDAVLTS